MSEYEPLSDDWRRALMNTEELVRDVYLPRRPDNPDMHELASDWIVLNRRIRTLEAERDRLRSACSAVAEADPADSFRWHQRNCRAALRSPEDTDTEGDR